MKRFLILLSMIALAAGPATAETTAQLFARQKREAEAGSAQAQYNLGLMYDNGEGVPEDDGEAVKWYRKAAEQGDARAQYNLGLRYEYGSGVPKDDVQAYAYYNLAAANGLEDAKKRRDELKLTNEQKAEAQALSTKLHQKIEANMAAKKGD